MYKSLIKSLLFFFSPETAHTIGMWGVRLIGFLHFIKLWPRFSIFDSLPTKTPFGVLGSPLGLAAGFDKNAHGLWGWQALGFSYVEVGTITPLAQSGNPRPRLFRHPELNALVNRMGFNNDGVHVIARRIKRAKRFGLKIKVGGNIGKNFQTKTEDAHKDYALAALGLKDAVDYLVVNISSPNTPGLRDLQNEDILSQIVRNVKSAAPGIPIFIKVAPDNFETYREGVLSVVESFKLAGVVCGNTLATHNLEKGGQSGAPLFEINLELCKAYSQKNIFVIGVGGIDSASKASSYLNSCAQLIQIYTGLIYEGPFLPLKILKNMSHPGSD